MRNLTVGEGRPCKMIDVSVVGSKPVGCGLQPCQTYVLQAFSLVARYHSRHLKLPSRVCECFPVIQSCCRTLFFFVGTFLGFGAPAGRNAVYVSRNGGPFIHMPRVSRSIQSDAQETFNFIASKSARWSMEFAQERSVSTGLELTTAREPSTTW